MFTLFPGEEIVTQSSEGAVTLTTHRICYQYKDWGRSYNQNIMLEHVTSCENFYSSQVWALVLGGISLLASLIAAVNNNIETFGAAMLAAIAFGLFFLLTKRNFIIISSPSTQMVIKVTGMKQEKILSFINKLEQTKNQRVNTLKLHQP